MRLRPPFVATIALSAALPGCGKDELSGVDAGAGGMAGSADAPDGVKDVAEEPSGHCPTAEPHADTPCTVTEGDLCQYDAACCPHGYSCIGQIWKQIALDCNPPGLLCPSAPPDAGDSCDPCKLPRPCTFGACSNTGIVIGATCLGGRWILGPVACAPSDAGNGD
jgi:hypothetical protein